jgi:hypothetical protein
MQEFQSSFAAALRDPRLAPPSGIISHTASVPIKRFAVYRNNIMVSLIEALEARFPAAKRIVGADFFRAVARVYARSYPPRSPLMMVYGDGFPDFLATFEPAAAIAYLPDVARLEAARTRAYHAADAEPLPPSALADLKPDDLPTLRFQLHPSLEIVTSVFPIVAIWAVNAGDVPFAAIDDWRGEDALIVRPAFSVEVRRLPPGAAVFLQSLHAGLSLIESARMAQESSSDFDLAINLASLISAGLSIAFTKPT